MNDVFPDTSPGEEDAFALRAEVARAFAPDGDLARLDPQIGRAHV